MRNEPINVWSYLEEYDEKEEDILDIVKNVFNSGKLILGKNVELFEKEFSNFIGGKYGVGVGNGTDAIKLALLALGIEKGSEVITVSNTAVPTVSAIVDAGYKPVFCDVDLDTYNLSIENFESLITKKTKAVVVVHLYGHPANLVELRKICRERGIFIIEDCAQSHGAKLNNKFCGTFGDTAAFSFYPTKILGTFGDGGMCTTNNKKYYEKLKKLRFYGMEDQYFSKIDGYNSRLDEIHAAILRFKLKNLNNDIKARRRIADKYNTELASTDLVLPVELKKAYHSYYLYVVRHKNRDEIITKLKKLNINLNISYPWPIHTMPPFKNYKKGNLKNTELLSKEIFSLPMYPGLSEDKIDRVVSSISKFI